MSRTSERGRRRRSRSARAPRPPRTGRAASRARRGTTRTAAGCRPTGPRAGTRTSRSRRASARRCRSSRRTPRGSSSRSIPRATSRGSAAAAATRRTAARGMRCAMRPTSAERYAVVSCHVERPLDDAVWAAFADLQRRRPGGFAVAALMRPPDAEAGEHDEELWLAARPRGRRPRAARPPHALHEPDPRTPDRRRHRAHGCGARARGCATAGWRRRSSAAAAGTPIATSPRHARSSGTSTARRGRPGPATCSATRRGRSSRRLPSSTSTASRCRSCRRPTARATSRGRWRGPGCPDRVHAYFHDTDLLDSRRRTLIVLGAAAPRPPPARRPISTRSGPSSARPTPSVAWTDVARGEARRKPRRRLHPCRPRRQRSRRARDEASCGRRRRRPALARLPPLPRARGRRPPAGAERRGARRRRRRRARARPLRRARPPRGRLRRHRSTGRCSGTPGPREWLPFLAPVTVLVFLQAGLYAPRERRAGAGRVARGARPRRADRPRVRLGTGLRLHDDRADPDRRRHVRARDRRPPRRLRLGLARADAGRRDPPPAAPRRRGRDARATSSGELRAARGGIGIRRRSARSRPRGRACRGLGSSLERPRRRCSSASGRTSCPRRGGLRRADGARRRPARPPDGRARCKLAPTTTELLVHEGEYVPGQGVPLFELRPPILSGVALGREAGVRPRRRDASLIVLGLPLWLVLARGDQARLARARCSTSTGGSASASASSGCSSSARWSPTPPTSRPSSRSDNEASGALFKIRDDPRVTRVGRAPAAPLARRAAAARERARAAR